MRFWYSRRVCSRVLVLRRVQTLAEWIDIRRHTLVLLCAESLNSWPPCRDLSRHVLLWVFIQRSVMLWPGLCTKVRVFLASERVTSHPPNSSLFPAGASGAFPMGFPPSQSRAIYTKLDQEETDWQQTIHAINSRAERKKILVTRKLVVFLFFNAVHGLCLRPMRHHLYRCEGITQSSRIQFLTRVRVWQSPSLAPNGQDDQSHHGRSHCVRKPCHRGVVSVGHQWRPQTVYQLEGRDACTGLLQVGRWWGGSCRS